MTNNSMKPDFKPLKGKSLALFFTCGVSLEQWRKMGLIDREVAIYNELSRHFNHIYFFTYGRAGDLALKEYLAGNITVVPMKCVPSRLLYSFLLPLIHGNILRNVDVIKTNQMLGSWSAVLARIIHRKKLVVRTGYTWSVSLAGGPLKPAMKLLSKTVEKLAYAFGDAAITSSQMNYAYVQSSYHPRNHVLISNYVETDIFKPLNSPRARGSICFVGRLSPEKNLMSLLEALGGQPYTLDIIGAGPQLDQLKQKAARVGAKANFLGSYPNHQLPEILNRHELFILPSLWENMPKTLLEAMACGLPVIGASVSGIKEVIKDGDNGVLCGTDPQSIRQAVVSLMENEALKTQLGKNARKTIEESFSLTALKDKELDLYARLLSPPGA